MPASLNDIHRTLGELTATVRAINDKVDVLSRDVSDSEDKSETSRANVHRRLDEVVMRTTNLEADVSGIKHRVEAVGAVTDDVKSMRLQAQGAGTLGSWLIKIGVGVIGAAGWAVGVYTYLTGKPPP